MEKLTDLENILVDVSRTKSMIKILDEHFTCEREKDITLDWFSITRLFNEYGDLSSKLIIDMEEIESRLKSIIDVFYKKLKEEN